jgi:hypothetical protein
MHGFDVDSWLVTVSQPALDGEHVAFAVPDMPGAAASNPRVAAAFASAGVMPGSAAAREAVSRAQEALAERIVDAALARWQPRRAAVAVLGGMGRELEELGCYRLTAQRRWGQRARACLAAARPALECSRLSEVMEDDGLSGALFHYLSVLAVTPLYMPRTQGGVALDPQRMELEEVCLDGTDRGVLAFTGRDTMGHFTREEDVAYDVLLGRRAAAIMAERGLQLFVDPGSAFGQAIPAAVVRALRGMPAV